MRVVPVVRESEVAIAGVVVVAVPLIALSSWSPWELVTFGIGAAIAFRAIRGKVKNDLSVPVMPADASYETWQELGWRFLVSLVPLVAVGLLGAWGGNGGLVGGVLAGGLPVFVLYLVRVKRLERTRRITLYREFVPRRWKGAGHAGYRYQPAA